MIVAMRYHTMKRRENNLKNSGRINTLDEKMTIHIVVLNITGIITFQSKN